MGLDAITRVLKGSCGFLWVVSISLLGLYGVCISLDRAYLGLLGGG